MGKDDEKFKNFIFFHIWATDDEMESMMPIFIVIALLIGVGFAIKYIFF